MNCGRKVCRVPRVGRLSTIRGWEQAQGITQEYFKDLERHKKDFIWVDDQDGDAIELATQKLIKYSVNKELKLFSVADLQRSILSMVDGLKHGQRNSLALATRGGKDHASARYIYTKLMPIIPYMFPKDDHIILDYLNEDGKNIKPTRYMPLIPTILVNGSEGTGTGWRSYVPNYNPRDLVANVRRLLNDEPMDPMDPWYKGFRVTVEKTPTKETGG
ncbi:hypothetical protein LguiB_018651 [Lonicera macranthoides]